MVNICKRFAVLLSANVGLLAIQNVDNQQGSGYRSVAEIASYASIILSLASYLTGHILSLQRSRELRDGERGPVSGPWFALLIALISIWFASQLDVEYLIHTTSPINGMFDRIAVIYRSVSGLGLRSYYPSC